MNFYVPTIGDSIYLLQPWTFTLHQERRNLGLAKRMEQCGHVKENISYRTKVECIKAQASKQNSIFGWRKSWSVGETFVVDTNSPEHQEALATGHWKDVCEQNSSWKTFDWKNKQVTVTLPVGTQLKVDRIYIRGTSRDYDSITFRIGECKENKLLSKARFWVKLKDANKIKCDLQPIADKDAAEYYKSLSMGRFNIDE